MISENVLNPKLFNQVRECGLPIMIKTFFDRKDLIQGPQCQTVKSNLPIIVNNTAF